jgi:uncharacterized protein YvpB
MIILYCAVSLQLIYADEYFKYDHYVPYRILKLKDKILLESYNETKRLFTFNFNSFRNRPFNQ